MPLVSPIYSPRTLLECLKLNKKQEEFIFESRETAKRILSGEDSRKVIILGPCSIHNYESAIEYGHRLKALQEAVKESVFLVMRVYVEKPRTTIGWKGFLYDPYLNGTDDILQGIKLSRKLLLELTEIGVPAATEFVNPTAALYLQDLITWGFIGARTSSSQIHRELVSSLPMPVGFKNTTEGNLQLAINGAIASRVSHSYLGVDEDGKVAVVHAQGNPSTHIVLRGSDSGANFDARSIEYALRLQNNCGLHSPILVDAAHGNSKKNHLLQEEVFLNIAEQMCGENPLILGIMAESFLEPGNQPFEMAARIDPETSITDPCMSWDTSERLVLKLMNNLDPHGVLPDVNTSPLTV